MQLRAIIREWLQLRYAAALIKTAHLSDALNVACCKCALKSYLNS
jgi:Holliday junction resolvasome RuvABC endonuclease subunit